MSFQGSPPDIFPETKPGSENPRQRGFSQIMGYEIECEIGRGGMATVYCAMQHSLGRQVAIKVLAHRLDDDHEFTQRFKKEGRILAQLLHPNIVTIYDIGISENNQLFLSVEYLPGGTLKEKIRQGLSSDLVVQIVKSIAKALGYAHERGVIHRDIKPSNIIFRQDGTPVLTDFGIARMIGSKTIHTATGLMIGTPGYMSPEQAMGESATIQSDLYGLGVVLYEMLTGHLPFKADNPLAIMLKHLHDPIPKLPKEYVYFQPILNKLLAKKIEDRYKNTTELLEVLDLINPSDTRSITDYDNLDVVGFSRDMIWNLLNNRSRFSVWTWTIGVAILLITVLYTIKLINSIEIFRTPGESEKIIRQLALMPREIEITKLLEQADAQMKVGLLTDESGQSAEVTYRRVLKLDQGNAPALAGLENIAKEYERLARQSFDAGLLRNSLDQIRKGLAVVPENERLIRLHQEAERRVTEIKTQEAEREQQRQAQSQAEQLLIQAQSSVQEGLLEQSLAYIDQGLLVVSNHQDLLALREQVKTRIAEQKRQKEEVRRQTEQAERQKAEQKRQQAEMARRREEANQSLGRALSYHRNGRYSASLQQIEKGLALVSNHEGLLRLRDKVRTDRLVEQKRQDARRQTAKETKVKKYAGSQTQPTVILPKEGNDVNLKKLQSIKNAVDALDKSLGR